MQFSELDHVHRYSAERQAIAERHHQVEDAGRNKFRFELWIEILRREPERRGQFFLVELCGLEGCFLLRHGHAMRASVLKADFHRQNSRARFLENVYAAFLGRNDAKLREQEPRSDDRMPRKLQLFFRGEDAQSCEGLFIGGLLHEDRFREIHLARNRQHLVVREFVAVGENGKRVACKACGGEDIKRVVAALHGSDSRLASSFRCAGAGRPSFRS